KQPGPYHHLHGSAVMGMSVTDFFAMLGAPLVSPRWSWGSVRSTDGIVFLRVWQDLDRKQDGKWYIKVLWPKESYEKYPDNPGWKQRAEQVELIKEGAKCYMVMCEAADTSVAERRVKAFDDKRLFPGGALIKIDDDWWLERRSPVSYRDAMPGS